MHLLHSTAIALENECNPKYLSVFNQLLQRLPMDQDASFNSHRRQHEPTCLPGTRVDLLRDIYNWADGEGPPPILWLNGLVGTGKSTIARTVARRYFDQNQLGASFFFSQSIKTVENFVASIAFQLAENIPALRPHIAGTISQYDDIATMSLHDQLEILILSPLSKLRLNSQHVRFILVVDALDECKNSDTQTILDILTNYLLVKLNKLRIFITSRPRISIEYGMSHLDSSYYTRFDLHRIPRSIVDYDITIFLEQSLKGMKEEYSLDSQWPGEENIKSMVQKSHGLFVWAATSCNFMREGGKQFAVERLDAVLSHSEVEITAPEKYLDVIYLSVLERSISSGYEDNEKGKARRRLRNILGSIVALSSPLSIYTLSELLSVYSTDMWQALGDVHSILDISRDDTPLHLHHPAFRDFLFNKDRCKSEHFWVDEKGAHLNLADRCLRLMSESLRPNICGLDIPEGLSADIDGDQVKASLSPGAQYACLNWVQHVQKSSIIIRDGDQVHKFLTTHLLHWMEAMAWMEETSGIKDSITMLASMMTVSGFRCEKRKSY